MRFWIAHFFNDKKKGYEIYNKHKNYEKKSEGGGFLII